MKQNGAMTKTEMYGQPASFGAINDTKDAIFATLDEVFRKGKPYRELLFTGCGTSLYLAQASAAAFTACTGIPAKGVPCSELYFFPEAYIKDGNYLVLPITRKSYTTEVRRAIDKVRALPNVTTLAITCDADSRDYNDYMILSPETAEDSVVMTRSFTSMVYLAVLMALYVGGKDEELKKLDQYPEMAQRVLEGSDALAQKIIAEHPDLNLFITLGQGIYYGIANECMNKMKEMGLTNSEAYYDLEYRHGPMSLVDDKTLIVCLSHRVSREADVDLLTQMKGYGAIIAVLGEELGDAFSGCADYVYSLDEGYGELLDAPVIGLIGQTLGLAIAAAKGLDADTPRHLSQAIVLK